MIIDIAKAVPIETEIARRGIKLAGHRSERVGPCPVCGGRDRFSINTMKGVWNCRGCSRGGDVIDLVMYLDGVNHKTAVRALAGIDVKNLAARSEVTASRPVQSAHLPKAANSDEQNSKRALRIWDDAGPIAGTLAETYLRRRGLELPDDDGALRYYSQCPFGQTTYPALIALFRDIVTDQPKAIHRIALATGGILINKMMLGPVAGCAVKIDADENVEYGLTIAEGIETALGGRMLGFKPAWALGSAGALRNFPVLSGITTLSILTDNDPPDANGRQAGQQAAAACAERWVAAGVEVHRMVPRRAGADMADIAAQGGRHG